MIIDQDFSGLMPALSEEEYQQLEQNIISDGCRDALTTWQGILIDGHNRYQICTKHGIEYRTEEKEFSDRDAAMQWIILNQFGRRNLPIYERARLALRLKPILAARAKERQRGGQGGILLPQKSAEAKETREELAKVAGVSRDTIHKVERIEAAATEEVIDQLRHNDISINEAYKKITYKEREEKREATRQGNAIKVQQADSPEKLNGLFQTIVVDPPWDWGDEGDINQLGRAKPDYATIPISEIMALPVDKLSDINCHLYLWATNRSLPKAFGLIEKWGFRYITCITWVKPSIGMGNYFRGDTEQLLFAVKGSQHIKRKDVGTHFNAPRGDKHSSKPIAAYDLIESCSYGPFLEMFSRVVRAGWTAWGEGQ